MIFMKVGIVFFHVFQCGRVQNLSYGKELQGYNGRTLSASCMQKLGSRTPKIFVTASPGMQF